MLGKGEESYLGDKLIDTSEMNAGRGYRETRDWYSGRDHGDIQLSFMFITVCFDDRLRRKLESYEKEFG